MGTTIAFLADVHGNRHALAAVLEDLAGRGADRVVNLGDNTNGPLEPQACADLLRAHCAVHVRGNGDRLTAAGGTTDSTRFAAARIDAGTQAWLGALPLSAGEGDWLACHGSPADDTFYLLEEVGPHGVALRPDADIAAALGGISSRVIACGHTHVPRVVRLADGRVVVNPGSVGLPAYADTAPFPHRMETGSPHARYALVHFRGAHVEVELRCVGYDWEAAAALAERNGRPGWGPPLRTGRA